MEDRRFLAHEHNKDSTLDAAATIHHRFLAFDPERMLAYRTAKPPHGFPFPETLSKTWVVIYLEPTAEKAQTRVTLRMRGFTTDEDSQKRKAFFERGNQITMDALVKRFTPPPAR